MRVVNPDVPRMFPINYPGINTQDLYLLRTYTRGDRFGDYEYGYYGDYDYLGFGDDGRYIPSSAQILSAPKPGYWYQIKKGETWWGVAKKAYGASSLKKGLLLMNASTWNDHINRKATGWEAYRIKGLQATPDYDLDNPHDAVGSGSDYPVAWIPPLTGEEPEDVHEDTGGGGTNAVVGPVGPRGPKGDVGPAGPMGPSGATGPQGPMGPMGPAGTINDQAVLDAIKSYLSQNPITAQRGATGPQGPMGPQGPRGETGPAGTINDEAIVSAIREYLAANPIAAGARGPAGATGPQGPRGERGPAGPQGPAGPSGGGGGGGADGKMWAVPLVGLLAAFAK